MNKKYMSSYICKPIGGLHFFTAGPTLWY